MANSTHESNKDFLELRRNVGDDPALGVGLGDGPIIRDLGQNRQIFGAAELINGIMTAQTGPVDHGADGFTQGGKGFPGKLKVIDAKGSGLGDQNNNIGVEDGINRRATDARGGVEEGIDAGGGEPGS